MAGFPDIGGLLKQGKEALEAAEKARKLKEQAEKEAGKAGVGGAKTSEVTIGQASPLAAEVEKLMTKAGLQITENGTISALEAGPLKKLIAELGKSDEVIKKGVKFDDGKIIFTKEALEHLEIKVPEPAKDKEKTSAISRAVDVAEIGAPNIGSNGGPRQLG